MRKNQSSLTAAGIALARAVESEKPEGERLCYDPYAREMAGKLMWVLFKPFVSRGYGDRAAPGVNEFLLVRETYIDDVLRENIQNGARQVVILGAGFDSRAIRMADILGEIPVFEVDQETTQRAKIKKLQRILGSLPAQVHYVTVDFNTDDLHARLMDGGYDEHLKTLFIWQGVTMYLAPSGVEGTLGFISTHSAPGSEVVFDYLHSSRLSDSVKSGEIRRMQRYSGVTGEGLTFSLDANQVASFMEKFGFTSVNDMTTAELKERYFTGARQNRPIAEGYGIVRAKVG